MRTFETNCNMKHTMNVAAVVTILATVLLRTSSAFYSMSSMNARPVMCDSDSKPCRINVKMRTFDGEEADSNSVQTCSCNQPYECSDDWDKPRHVVNRKLVSTTYNITLQMMFCRPVEPTSRCTRRQIALEVKGSLTLPQDISAYNCRCRRRKPLILHERGIGEDHLVYHKYVCSNHKNYCRGQVPCMTIDPYSTSYHCKCPRNTQCRADTRSWLGNSGGGDNEEEPSAYGYCRPSLSL